MIGETVWDNIPTDFLESVLSTRRFINSPSIVPLISHSLIQTLSSNNFHVSSLINHLLNGYYIFQIDRSITRARCSSILIISPYIIWSTFLKFLKFFTFVSRFPLNRGESFVRPHATATPREYFYSHAEARAKKKDRAASSRVSLFNACPRKTGSRHWKGYGQVYSPPSKGFKSRGYLNDPRIYALSHVVSNRTEKVVGNCCSRRTRILNNSQSSRSFVSLDRSIIQVDKCIFIISGFWYSGFNLLWFKKKGQVILEFSKEITLRIGSQSVLLTRGRERGTFETGESASKRRAQARSENGDIFSAGCSSLAFRRSAAAAVDPRERLLPPRGLWCSFIWPRVTYLPASAPSINYWPRLFPALTATPANYCFPFPEIFLPPSRIHPPPRSRIIKNYASSSNTIVHLCNLKKSTFQTVFRIISYITLIR